MLLLLSHPWWLLAFDMSLEHGQGRVLSAIYPTQEGLYAALACSVSVFVFLFVYPFRQSVPRIMAAAYTLVLTDCVVMMVRMGIQVYLTAGEFDELLWLSLFFLTLGCLVELYWMSVTGIHIIQLWRWRGARQEKEMLDLQYEHFRLQVDLSGGGARGRKKRCWIFSMSISDYRWIYRAAG
ncbi:DUF2919 family protein [Escherichia coli]|nr:DUF2919 family protein [Escherichia coli]